jgi:hypothetical protein
LASHVIGAGREGGKANICPFPERERILIPKINIIFLKSVFFYTKQPRGVSKNSLKQLKCKFPKQIF